MKKIYISGCGGMLGDAFYKYFSSYYTLRCTDIDTNENWLSYLDIRNFAEYRKDVLEFDPDWLFHLGAYTDLEFCENNPDETYITNTLSVENAVFIANELKIPILYISTAGIFDGKKPYYDDWDIPNPLGVYARSKWAGENYVVKNATRYFICRPGWMMGGGYKKDKKFVNKIVKQLLSGRRELFIVDDRDGTPTYTHDFARNVDLLMKNNYWGLYNMVCESQTSRLEVTEEILKIIGIESKVKIKKVNSDYFKDEYYVLRPNSERLINKKLSLRSINIMRDWKVTLKEYLENEYTDIIRKIHKDFS